jgi:alanine racemase
MPQTHLEMVRSGIGTSLGSDPDSDECRLPGGFSPVLSWKAIVVQVNSLAPGEAISWSRTHHPQAHDVLAVIPVGYADGFPLPPPPGAMR